MALETIALGASIVGMAFSSGMSTVLWRKLGNLETSNKALQKSNDALALAVKNNACPWGAVNCPSFERARSEAAPSRDVGGENHSG